MNRPRCVIYIRVSGESQREGASLEVQLADCERYAEREGWNVVQKFVEVGSGLITTRPVYQEMLDVIAQGAVDIVLIWRLDRFGRDDGEGITRCNELDRMHVDIVSATQGRLDPMTRGILFVVAKQESRNTSERVHPNIKRRVEEGLWTSRPPFGFRMREGHKGRLEVLEPEAAVIREMFQRAYEGESLRSIQLWLNTQQEVRPHRASSFSLSWISKALSNPAYAGWVTWNRLRRSKIDGRWKKAPSEIVKVPGLHAALVSQEVFDIVQSRLVNPGFKNQGKNSGQWLLTGIVRCAICDHGMYGQWNNYSRKKRTGAPFTGYIYKCHRKGHPWVNGKKLDAWVLGFLAELPVGDAAVEAVEAVVERESGQRPDRTKELHAARTRQLERRKRLVRMRMDEEIGEQEFHDMRAEVNIALAAIDQELASLEPVEDFSRDLEEQTTWLRGLTNLELYLHEATLEERAGYVSRAIEKVVVADKSESGWEIKWREWAAQMLYVVTQ